MERLGKAPRTRSQSGPGAAATPPLGQLDLRTLVDTEGRTPLIVAARERRVHALKAMLDAEPREVDVNARDRGGWTALMHAANRGFLDVVQTLFAAGANLTIPTNRTESTALMIAAQQNELPVITFLLSVEPESLVQQIVDQSDNGNWTALGHALSQSGKTGRVDIVEALLNAGSKPFALPPNEPFNRINGLGIPALALLKVAQDKYPQPARPDCAPERNSARPRPDDGPSGLLPGEVPYPAPIPMLRRENCRS